MPFSSPDQIHIPDISVATYVFGSPTKALPNEPLFIDDEQPDSNYLTLSSYRLWSQRFAVGLRKRGFNPGERVLVYSTNSIYYLVGIMGTIMAGGIFTGSSPGYTARELAYHMKDAKPSYALIFPEGFKNGLDAARQAGVPDDRIFIFDGTPTPKTKYEFPHWSGLFAPEEEGRGFAWAPCDTRESASAVVALNYSSGTTGLAKGVMITHKNYVSNLAQFGKETLSRVDPITKDSIHLAFLPFNHAMAQMMLGFGVPVWGGKCYVQKTFDFMKVMKAIEMFKVDNLLLVPPVIVAMSKTPALRSGKIDLGSVRTVGTGAAPISGDTLKEFETLFPDDPRVRVRNGYGMSEATCGVTPGPRGAEAKYIKSVGMLLANMEGKIMEDDGKTEILDRGTPTSGARSGELWLRGPNVMRGYWEKPDATADTITKDGWLRTGDVCVVDEEARMYIVDRKKELIKVKGNQVAPAELEALLLEHPSIADAAVIGVPTEDGDEVPRAYVVLKQGEKADEKNVQDFVAGKVNKNKRLRGGVHFTDAIPKNPSGKILRKTLREIAAKERETRAKL